MTVISLYAGVDNSGGIIGKAGVGDYLIMETRSARGLAIIWSRAYMK